MTTIITCDRGEEYKDKCLRLPIKGCIGCEHIEYIEKYHSQSLG